MDLVTGAQRMVGLVEERCDHRLEPTACKSAKAGLASPVADVLEESIDPRWPVRVNKLFELLSNGGP